MALVDSAWAPASWRALPALHRPEWPDPAALEAALDELRSMPPLVFAGEARELREALAEVHAGRAFLLQAGDCAESFHDRSAPAIREKLKILLQMSVALMYGSTLPVVKTMRIAGQFAKRPPPSRRRDRAAVVPGARRPLGRGDRQARRRIRRSMVYYQAAALNLLRAHEGLADPARAQWNQGSSQLLEGAATSDCKRSACPAVHAAMGSTSAGALIHEVDV
jgi:3-deoxy-7-phosphoheptulonate synthase